MSLSDCEKCWDTPCSCGWDYRLMTQEARAKFAAVVLGIDPKSSEMFALLDLTPLHHPKAKS